MAVGTLVFDRSSYENVVCLGLLLDEQGRKMSKHLGNVLDPFELFDSHGADAVRWLMLAQGSPWVDRRVGHDALREIVRKVLLTYWNTTSFLVTVRQRRGLGARPGSPSSRRTRWTCWVRGELRRLRPRRHRARSRTSTPPAPGARSRASSTGCRTGTCAARGAGSGTATRRRWRRCTPASRPSAG